MNRKIAICGFLLVAYIVSAYSAAFAAPLIVKGDVILPSPSHGSQRYPAISFAKGIFLVVWREGRYGWGPPADTQIRAVRVSEEGNVLDTKSLVISAAADFQEEPDIATDGNIFLVVWQDMRNGKDYDIYAARVDPEGRVLDKDGIRVAVARHNQCKPRVSFDGNDFVIAWMDNRDFESSYHIRFTRVTPQGKVLEPDGVWIAGQSEETIGKLLNSDALRGVPVYTFPQIACNKGECLVGWLQKIDVNTDSWQEYPVFRYVRTQPELSLKSKPINLPDLPVSYPHYRDKSRYPAISIASNDDRYLAGYSGIRGKHDRDFFIVGNIFESEKQSSPIVLRPLAQGVKNAERVVPYKEGFIICWAEGDRNYFGSEPIKYSIRGAFISRYNKVDVLEIHSPMDVYLGFPVLAIGANSTLLVYEQIDERYGLKIIGKWIVLPK
jgi:hypothetical protein